jgi:hypothetical protein
VLVCNSTNTQLVPDHLSCNGANVSCGQNEQCASCDCQSGLCFTSNAQHCPTAVADHCP